MMYLSNLPALFEAKQAVVALETPITERIKVLAFLFELAKNHDLPLYFWNQGYSQLQKVDDSLRLDKSDNACISGLNWLLQHPDVPGIFVFEGVISPDAVTSIFPPQTATMLSNFVYEFVANPVPRFLVCLSSYVELPVELIPLIPVLINPLPSTFNDGGVSRQLAGKLLTWMQERTSQVLVMATVNRLEFLPPELVRRFDEIIFVDLPHASARYEIFKLHLAKYFPGLDFCEKDWLRLLRETKLLTPAEIAMMVRKTAQEAFYRNTQEFSTCELGEKPLTVTVKDFLEVRNNFTPSMIREEDKIVEIRNQAVYARPAALPDTSRWAKEPEVLFGS
jgi:ATPase family associated with various cellular activities (AAA)